MTDLITADEIKQLKTSPRHLSWKDVGPGGGVDPPIKPTKLNSVYMVSYNICSIFEDDVKIEHAIIGADDFEPDPADADEIARALLGRCARAPAAWTPQERRTHYVKLIGLDDKNLEQEYEEGIERGVTMLEAKT